MYFVFPIFIANSGPQFGIAPHGVRAGEKAPALPKFGPPKTTNNRGLNNNNDFLKTPDAGVAG